MFGRCLLSFLAYFSSSLFSSCFFLVFCGLYDVALLLLLVTEVCEVNKRDFWFVSFILFAL